MVTIFWHHCIEGLLSPHSASQRHGPRVRRQARRTSLEPVRRAFFLERLDDSFLHWRCLTNDRWSSHQKVLGIAICMRKWGRWLAPSALAPTTMAYGMSYWIDQMSAGQSITQIAEQFYAAGVKYSNLTGFSSEMSNEDFINVIYRNVLGRSDGADAGGLAYWTSQLGDGADTCGSLVKDILFSAHSYKTNQEWHWVADLLDNKIEVGKTFAITWGLSYNTPEDSISQGMAIAAAVTSTDTATAIALIGVPADLYFG
jgi:hypothetical protein